MAIKILGNRILVSRVEEEKTEGFQTVNVQDSFVNKGKVEQVGNRAAINYGDGLTIKEGDIVLFAKYSPDTQEVDKDHKIISVDDILAIW